MGHSKSWCSIKGHILMRLHVLGPPLDGLDPFSYTLKLTNGSAQNFMNPLNFTRHVMPKSFAELLTPKIVIVNNNKTWKWTNYDTETKKSSSGGQYSELQTPLICIEPFTFGFCNPYNSVGPLECLSPCYTLCSIWSIDVVRWENIAIQLYSPALII